MEAGYTHIYTGSGKGKTTAALGLGLRAVGAGLKVYMVQFMKGSKSSELNSSKNISNFNIFYYGRNEFVSRNKPSKLDINLAQEGLDYVRDIINSERYDVVILDEINVALDFGLLSLDKVIELVKSKPKNLELVLTGRNAPKQLIELADLVTEMKEIKHPFQKGILARKGIDY